MTGAADGVDVLSAGEIDAFSRLAGDALRLAPAVFARFLTSADPGRGRVVRGPGGVIAGLVVVPLEQFFGGVGVASGGVSMVAVAPEHRGRGLATRLLRRALSELADAGVPLSVLHPANLPLYRDVGYEVAAEVREHEVSLGLLPRARGGVVIEPIELGDRLEELTALQRAWAALGTAVNDRPPALWTSVEVGAEDPVRACVALEGDRIRGWAVYSLARKDTVIRARDLCALDGAAATALLAFFASHRPIYERLGWRGPPSDVFTSVLPDKGVTASVRVAMQRIVDVGGALSARGYPAPLTARLELEVSGEDVLPANAGRYVVEIDGGRAAVTPGGRGAIRLGVRALAALYTGHASPSFLRTLGALEAGDRDAAMLTLAFAGPAPYVEALF